MKENKVANILVHITHGPEHPTRAALGFHVAKASVDEGHSVTIFLAGDGVQLMRDGAIDHLNGLGTGNLRELYDAVISSGVKIYLSGMSSKSRGLSEEELEGKPYEFGHPRDLVRLAVEHDRIFTY
jgi:predicted peroxiredoxin